MITRTTARWTFEPDGATRSFPFDNLVINAADMVATWYDASGNTLALPAFDVNGLGIDTGGTVDFETDLADVAGSLLVLERHSAAVTVGADPKNFLQDPAKTRQYYRDIGFALAQEATATLRRTLQLSPHDPDADAVTLPPAALRANMALLFDSQGRWTVGAPLAAGSFPVSAFMQGVLGAIDGPTALGDLGFSVFMAGIANTASATALLTALGLSANGKSLVTAVNYAAMSVLLAPSMVTLLGPQLPATGRRQTVPFGPIDANGLPSFLPATTVATLTLTEQNVAVGTPFVAMAANGWATATGLPVDAIGLSAANQQWVLPQSATNYLYKTVNANGTLATGFTSLEPIYQWKGAPSTTNGQFTFNVAEMKGYMGTGATAPQANIVFVGKAVTNTVNVTSTVMYAYNGYYESAWTATLPGAQAAVNFNHNIGVKPSATEMIAECTTADQAYSVGQQLTTSTGLMSFTNGSQYVIVPIPVTALTAIIASSNNGNPWGTLDLTNHNTNSLANANWKYKIVCNRGW